MVFCGCLASQTHIPTRNRYLVSSKGLKIHVSVWVTETAHSCMHVSRTHAPPTSWGRPRYKGLYHFCICLLMSLCTHHIKIIFRSPFILYLCDRDVVVFSRLILMETGASEKWNIWTRVRNLVPGGWALNSSGFLHLCALLGSFFPIPGYLWVPYIGSYCYESVLTQNRDKVCYFSDSLGPPFVLT